MLISAFGKLSNHLPFILKSEIMISKEKRLVFVDSEKFVFVENLNDIHATYDMKEIQFRLKYSQVLYFPYLVNIIEYLCCG